MTTSTAPCFVSDWTALTILRLALILSVSAVLLSIRNLWLRQSVCVTDMCRCRLLDTCMLCLLSCALSFLVRSVRKGLRCVLLTVVSMCVLLTVLLVMFSVTPWCRSLLSRHGARGTQVIPDRYVWCIDVSGMLPIRTWLVRGVSRFSSRLVSASPFVFEEFTRLMILLDLTWKLK